jgi:hypothetical protein
VVLGIPWTTGMFTKDADGTIHPTGAVVAGHAILWRAEDQMLDNILHNTWGYAWGECFISDEDLYAQMAQQGEALLTVRLAATPVKPQHGRAGGCGGRRIVQAIRRK